MIEHRWDGSVLVVTLDRPERRNALDRAALDGLVAALDEATSGPARALVLRGEGNSFCAGADLSTVEDEGFVDRLLGVLTGLRDAPFPTIAAVHGAALGAGTQLAAACDLRTATEDAAFGIPAARLGLMVDEWTIRWLTVVAGASVTRSMLVGARTWSGTELAATGFVHRLGAPDVALEWAHELAGLAPLTIAGHKLGCNVVAAAQDDDPGYAQARAAAWASDDLREGLAAFGERRRPEFRGR
jgi:enoyl-CoA hydratase